MISFGKFPYHGAGNTVFTGTLNYSTTSGWATVTGSTINITTKGNLVKLGAQGNGVGQGEWRIENFVGQTTTIGQIRIIRDGSIVINYSNLGIQLDTAATALRVFRYPLGIINCLDLPPAGPHTYIIQLNIASGVGRIALASGLFSAVELILDSVELT